ncbi:hypothetical protein GCM10025868_33120 [Angustibacter aerolatus]|uniref:DNA-directed RNA polymerase RpoA/D/Rpb3-type domain-containing protein n=1 Tax=Angustibacter aerolatus TaxID=1162965 RepID=A0ABQ6JIJ3_9ACTN|nr:hypothetical protein GCM10025868_33120 [Angustibacter aerolatus]
MLKVTYKVEATRVEQRTDFDKLVVDVETKMSIAPRDAMASAGKTLTELFGLAREAQRRGRGHRHGPLADGCRAGGRPGAADRGASSSRSGRTTA